MWLLTATASLKRVLRHCNTSNADDIRRCLCCYLEENFALFAEFLSVSDQDDPNERYLQYFQNVEELRQPGKWSNDAADMLPLALASWTNQTVRIYSSSPVRPVVDIHPVTDQESDDKIINLALLEFQNAAITHAKQNTPIYTPSGWDIVLRMARRRKKYTVVPLSHTSFYNFKKVAEVSIHNTRIDTYGRKVNWLQIRFMQLHKGQEDFLYFKTNFDEEEFHVLCITSSAKRKRPKPLKALPVCYKDKLPISEAKKRDLLSLCTSGVIPEEHQDFFRKLSSSSSVGDKLPQPDINDSASTDTSDTD